MRDILLAFFLLTAFPVVIYRYQVGALIIAFISFMYPQSNAYGFATSIPWLDIYFILALGGYFLKQGYKNYEHHVLITMMFVMYLWVCLTTAFAFNTLYALAPWIKITKIMAIAYLVYAMLGTKKRLIALLKVLVISIGFYGIKGGIFTIISGGGAHVLGPINSFFADNNGMALVLVMVVPFMVYFAVHAENIYEKYFSLFCALTTSIAVLGTQSRTGFGALIVVLLYYMWLQKKLFRAFMIITPIACVALFVMPDSWTDRMASSADYETDSSFQGRVDMWKVSLSIANDYPVFGGGFNVIYVPEVDINYIPLEVRARAIHSAYFQMIAEHGYVGLIIFLTMLYYIFSAARRMTRQCKLAPHMTWLPDLTIAIRCSAAGYMVMAFMNNIAFFDLIYFVMVIMALADNLLQKELVSEKFSLHDNDRIAVTT